MPLRLSVFVCQGSLNFWHLSFAQLHFTIYVTASYLIYLVTSHMQWIYWHLFLLLVQFQLYYHAFEHFTMVILTCYDFKSHSIVLPMSIYDRLFWSWSILLLYYLHYYFNHTYKCLVIIKLWRYFIYFSVCPIAGFDSICLWIISTRVTVYSWIVIMKAPCGNKCNKHLKENLFLF